jgi:excinuclease ABC subunit C
VKKDELASFKLPDNPGIYIFKGENGERLYIGKATSLKSRVRSYFAPDLIDTRGERIVAMIEKARSVEWETTDSVLEALILEAQSIKKYQPPYNAREKDNKSYNYVVITKEAFPRVLTVRGRELFGAQDPYPGATVFGPYPEGGSLKIALRIIRDIFPYRDTCTPGVGRPCFNAQIGLCPGVCSGGMDAKAYRTQVQHIQRFLGGHKKRLLKDLEKERDIHAGNEEYEQASKTQRTIFALQHIHDIALIRGERGVLSDGGSCRIEAYDISHTGGDEVVGVMVTVVDGVELKSGYRKFILSRQVNDDIGNLKEVIRRRSAHTEWPAPDIIVADGGEPQRAAIREMLPKSFHVDIVSVLKDDRHKAREILGLTPELKKHADAILRANSEAHRFAITFHRRRLRKRLLA